MTQQTVLAAVERHAGLVTGGFYAQYDHVAYGNRRFLLHKEILPFSREMFRMRVPL
jgi:hypothetical protein